MRKLEMRKVKERERQREVMHNDMTDGYQFSSG